MKLSIIIPIYNVSPYIEKCLTSVINQANNNDVEIILVDDCGTDNSMDIVNDIMSKKNINNIKIISHTKNQGLSAARNTGVKEATGDYIFFLDSDDEMSTNAISLFKKYRSKYKNADFYIGNYDIIGKYNGNKLNLTKIEYKSHEIFNTFLKNDWYMMAWGKFINRTFFLDNKLWFPIHRLHEDEYFSFYLASCASKMIVIDENVYIYKIRENSISTLKRRKNYIDYYWILLSQIKTILSNNNIQCNEVYNYITARLFHFTRLVATSKLSLKEKLILIKWCKSGSNLLKVNTNNFKTLIQSLILKAPTRLLLFIINLQNNLPIK